jgi:hypothetical protein
LIVVEWLGLTTRSYHRLRVVTHHRPLEYLHQREQVLRADRLNNCEEIIVMKITQLMKKYSKKTLFVLSRVSVMLSILFSPTLFAEGALSARQTLERLSPIDYEIVLKLEAKRGRKFDDRELIAATNSKEFDIEYPRAKAAFCARAESAKSLACMESTQLKPIVNNQK